TTYTLDLSNVVPPSGFTTISDLTVELSFVHPHTAQILAELISPTGDVILLTAGTDYIPAPIGITDHANMGVTGGTEPFEPLDPGPVDAGTISADSAARYPDAPNTDVPWTGVFKPMNDLLVQPNSLQAFNGKKLTDSSIAGKWVLEITDDKADNPLD